MAARLLGLGYVVWEQRKKRGRVGGPVGEKQQQNFKVWVINLGLLTSQG